MDEITARVKKWGSSLGLVIPAPVAKRSHLSPGDTVRVRIEPLRLKLKDITGIFREELRDLDWDAVDRELATGWDDE